MSGNKLMGRKFIAAIRAEAPIGILLFILSIGAYLLITYLLRAAASYVVSGDFLGAFP